jgi:hypothetical protein
MSNLQGAEPIDSTGLLNVLRRDRRPVAPVYRVGEPLHRGRREWPHGAEFAFGPGGHELTVFAPAITDSMIEDVRRGPAEFALIVHGPILVLAYRFGESIGWEDAPYCWHLQPEYRRVVPAAVVATEARALLWVTLVGADDGIIHAQRGLTLSPSFTRALHDAIRRQAMSTFDSSGCTAAISCLYPPHLETVDRLPMAVARTMGNA